jgi:hypothetical protein
LVEPAPGPEVEDGAATGTRGISPLSALVITLTLVVVGIGIWASTRGADIAVWEVMSNVPAHHVLTRSDVKLAVRRAGGEFASYPIGHMTLRALGEGAPVREADLGPDVAGRLGQDAVVVGISASPQDAVAGSLAAGDFVEIISTATTRVAPVEGIVIATSVNRAEARPTYLLAVAVRRNDAQHHNWFRGPARLTLVRELSPAP